MTDAADPRPTPNCSDGRHPLTGAAYLVDGNPVCLRHALLRRSTLVRSARVAAIVGTVLFVINQLDTILRGDHGSLVIAKVLLTYAVPFAVATYAALAAVRTSPRPDNADRADDESRSRSSEE